MTIAEIHHLEIDCLGQGIKEAYEMLYRCSSRLWAWQMNKSVSLALNMENAFAVRKTVESLPNNSTVFVVARCKGLEQSLLTTFVSDAVVMQSQTTFKARSSLLFEHCNALFVVAFA